MVHDRIHLKTTHFLYAKHLESMGETVEAVKHYELSQTHKTEVPRMLFETQHFSDLEQYIKNAEDTSLTKWWAQYCESNGQYDDAIEYYEAAQETLALVRVYCYRGQDQKAVEICLSTGDQAACYHLAKQFETQENIKEAITFYTKAKKYNHGIRLAKENGMENELMGLALEASKELKVLHHTPSFTSASAFLPFLVSSFLLSALMPGDDSTSILPPPTLTPTIPPQSTQSYFHY
jgi:intraflagellar transport protein 140